MQDIHAYLADRRWPGRHPDLLQVRVLGTAADVNVGAIRAKFSDLDTPTRKVSQ